jgi:hypothetical protein
MYFLNDKHMSDTPLNKYVQFCEHCKSTQVARLEWINTNTGEPMGGGPGIYTEWCFNCNTETTIIDGTTNERRLDKTN